MGPKRLHRAMQVGAQLPSMTVRVGTDCSGLEAPLLALRAMQVPFHHVFNSEINPRNRTVIEENFASAPLQVYPDMLRRHREILP